MLGPSDGTLAVSSSFAQLTHLHRQISKDPPNEISADCASHSWTPSDGGVNVLMIGTGEFVTGYTDRQLFPSQNSVGIVALTALDLRRRNKIHRLGMCGKDGRTFPQIRFHLQETISKVYDGISAELETFPSDGEYNEFAHTHALSTYEPDAVILHSSIDSCLYQITLDAIERKIHVLLIEPIDFTLQQHLSLINAARRNNVLVAFWSSFRYDPVFIDARDRINKLGSISYIYSHVSQPYTIDSTNGRGPLEDGNDCSFFQNLDFVDFHTWIAGRSSQPLSVTCCSSSGILKQSTDLVCEKSATLMVQWENFDKSKGTAVHTSSVSASGSNASSKHHCFCMCRIGEVNIDHVHRGYIVADEEMGFRSTNPLFMKLTPTNGKFCGQNTCTYRACESFIDAVHDIKNGKKLPQEFDNSMATLATTLKTTAILHAGRLSLNSHRPVAILYDDPVNSHSPTSLKILE